MTWRAPAAFAGLVLLALPVLLHLLSRRPARSLAFPSLRFLAASTLTATRRTRISDVPLLLVRLAIVAMAVLALAQPGASASTTGGGAVALVVDRATVGLDAVWGVDSSASATSRRVVIGALPDVMEAAIGWLRMQPGPRRLVIRSAFVRGTLDSSDVVMLPSDVAVSFEQRPRATGDASRDSMVWQTGLSDADVAQVLAAVHAGRSPAVRAVGSDTVPLSGHTVVSTLSPPPARVRTPSAATVAVALALREDPAVRGVFESLVSAGMRAADSTPADSLTLALFTDGRGAPMLTARSVIPGDASAAGASGDSAAMTWLTIAAAGTTGERADVALAVLSALATRGTFAVTAPIMSDGELQRMTRLPAGVPIGAATVVADIHEVPTWARWLWAVVLALLALEWWMRRSMAWRASARGAA